MKKIDKKIHYEHNGAMKNVFLQKLKNGEPIIMGILNVTPDSFSDGDVYRNPQDAIKRAEQMMEEGADIIDVGGESTGPGSFDVSIEEEWNRIGEVITELEKKNIPFSVDTWKSKIAKRAIDLGALLINDVTGGRGDEEMFSVIAGAEVNYCLMYSKDNSPRTTIREPEYKDVVQNISTFLGRRMVLAQEKGVLKEKIILDPGMGAFLSSNPEVSFEVLERLQEFQKFQCPILVGTSRKSFLKKISDAKHPKDRVEASIQTSLMAIQNGAQIVRVHDVKEMRKAINFSEIFLQ